MTFAQTGCPGDRRAALLPGGRRPGGRRCQCRLCVTRATFYKVASSERVPRPGRHGYLPPGGSHLLRHKPPGRKTLRRDQDGWTETRSRPTHCVHTAGTLAGSRWITTSSSSWSRRDRIRKYDSYSAFKDDGGATTELDAILKARGIKDRHRVRHSHRSCA